MDHKNAIEISKGAYRYVEIGMLPLDYPANEDVLIITVKIGVN